MKRLSELTREELIELTEDEIQDLIDLECMYNGKPVMAERPKYLEVPSVPEKDVETFEVAGYVFTDQHEAESIKNMIENAESRVKLDYFGGNYDMKFVKQINDDDYDKPVVVKKNKAYSKERYADMKDVIFKIKDIKAANAELKASYDEIIEERQDIVAEVMDVIDKAHDDTYAINRAVKAYEKYLRLSNDNREVAMNFFEESEFGEYKDDVIKALNM